jgi:Leucine-rich repeat (LRR) protein
MKKTFFYSLLFVLFSSSAFAQKIVTDAELVNFTTYTSLPDSNFENVYKVNIQNIGGIPADITKYKNLQQFFDNGNDWDYIDTIPEEFFDLKNLTSVAFNNTNIRSINSSITKLKNLKELNITNNKIVSLPASLSEVASLKKLSIDQQIQALPPLPQLEKFEYTFYNDTTKICRGISEMKNLRSLKLNSYGGIDDIKNIVNQLQNLDKFNELTIESNTSITSNDLYVVSNLSGLERFIVKAFSPSPESLKKFTNLKYLQFDFISVESNVLKRNCMKTIADLPALLEVTTRFDTLLIEEYKKIKKINLFTWIEDDNLQKLYELKNIDSLTIASDLSCCPKNFDKIGRVKTLNLSKCKIDSACLGSTFIDLSKITNLENLYMNCSVIKYLPAEFGLLKHLKYLEIRNCEYYLYSKEELQVNKDKLAQILPDCHIVYIDEQF